jgi:hypothetical protein
MTHEDRERFVNELLANFFCQREQIEALPEHGYVRQFDSNPLCIGFTKEGQAYAAGVQHARIYRSMDEVRRHEVGRITNGHGEVAKLRSLERAKARSLEAIIAAETAIKEAGR